MPFLRGKLSSVSDGSFDVLNEILNELEKFYEEISRANGISEKELKKLELYRDMLVNALRERAR